MNEYDLTELVQLQREELNKRADRIAELEKQYDAMVMSFEARLATRGYEIQIKDQADRIAELEKEIQNHSMNELVRIGQELESEPYCWVSGGTVYYKESDIQRGKTVIPLYTTLQTKPEGYGKAVPLSDEEADDFVRRWFNLSPFAELNREYVVNLKQISMLVRQLGNRS
jgi:hypothetical protein